MRDKLRLLNIILQSKYPDFIKKFDGGLQLEKIKKFEKEKGLSFSKEYINLYEWKNGMATYYEEEILKSALFAVGIFIPIQESYTYYERLCLKEELCPKEYYPIFTSGYGDYYLVKQGEAEYNDPFIYFYSPALLIVEPTTIFDSLPIFITSITEAYEEQVIFRNAEGEVMEKDDCFSFMKIRNPNSEYWNK